MGQRNRQLRASGTCSHHENPCELGVTDVLTYCLFASGGQNLMADGALNFW